MKVLIMGLGLHGGGLESARFLLKRGAEITVTDLQDEKTLAPSVEQLEAFINGGKVSPVRYVLGRHEIDDFIKTDMVIKNPGAPPDSPFLQAARIKGSGRIETDISLFLAESPARLIAVTGSKGKSSTASAIHWVLSQISSNIFTQRRRGAEDTEGFEQFVNIPPSSASPRLRERSFENKISRSYLGGNITVSPLAFLDDLKEGDDVVLELSSWQLGDLRGRFSANNTPLLKPKAAVITAIMPDHLDRYGTMEAYVADKRVIYRGQDRNDLTIAKNDTWGRDFLEESKGRPLVYSETPLPEGISGGWLEGRFGPGFAQVFDTGIAEGEIAELVPAQPLVPGYHQKQNLLAAGLALLGFGMPAETIREGLASFPGVEHRLEMFHKAGGVEFYNDSAATIPEAAAAAVEALTDAGRQNGSLILVTGGTDKNLDFSPVVRAAKQVKNVILLAGSGSEKLRALLSDAGISFLGPFDSPDKAVTVTLEKATPGDSVVLSPGCASFGMFLNEFDRGRKWKEAVIRLA